MTNTERRVALEAQIEETHDMQEGQAWSWEASGICADAKCRICGLSHTYYRGGQNSPDNDIYRDSEGNILTLAEAARTACE